MKRFFDFMSSQTISSSPSEAPKKIKVSLGTRSYDILIASGLLAHAGTLISQLRADVKCSIVTDENVAKHHLAPLQKALSMANVPNKAIILPPGEATKSFTPLSTLVETLLSHEIERGDLVIALGGGVIGDLAGFAASILRRGVDFVQIPTSLLAQVDSSVGGKTGINSKHGKNLIGAFHQPILVLCDLDVLSTLEPRQFRAGYAEVVKYGLIQDPAFFQWLQSHCDEIYALDKQSLTHAIHTSCSMKADIVGRDEKEHGVRALLNLGHTFGHAFESLTGYGEKLLHGEAISIGMVLAFEFANKLELCPPSETEQVKAHFQAANLPTLIQDIPGAQEFTTQSLMKKMRQDKKVERGDMVFILPHEIGNAMVTRQIPEATLHDFLQDKLEHVTLY